jgi:hypothetical protein
MQVKHGSPLSRRRAALQTPVGRRAEQVKKSHPLAVRAWRCNPRQAVATPDGAAVRERTMDARGCAGPVLQMFSASTKDPQRSSDAEELVFQQQKAMPAP